MWKYREVLERQLVKSGGLGSWGTTLNKKTLLACWQYCRRLSLMPEAPNSETFMVPWNHFSIFVWKDLFIMKFANGGENSITTATNSGSAFSGYFWWCTPNLKLKRNANIGLKCHIPYRIKITSIKNTILVDSIWVN